VDYSFQFVTACSISVSFQLIGTLSGFVTANGRLWPTIKGLSEVLPHEIVPKSSTGAGRISDRPRLNEAASESEPPAMEIESSVGASRGSLPVAADALRAVGVRG
jgi:hypothetical protein